MAKQTTTVTHPDGRVSKRTSETRVYTHAVVITRTRESLVADALADAEREVSASAKYGAALGGAVTEESKPWSGGLTWTTLYVGGEWAGAHPSDKPRPSDDELQEHIRRQRDGLRQRADDLLAKAAQAQSGPAAAYGVLRWSGSEANALKAARGEYASLVRDGVTIDVVPVD